MTATDRNLNKKQRNSKHMVEKTARSLVSWTDAVVGTYILCKAWCLRSVLTPDRSVFDQVFHKMIELLDCNARHHHHMSYIALASKLPPPNELFILGPFKDNGAAKLVEHGADPRFTESVFKVMGVSQALLNFFLESFVAFAVKSVPKEQRSMSVSASHDCRIP